MFRKMNKAAKNIREMGKEASARRAARREARDAAQADAAPQAPPHLANQECEAVCQGCGATVSNTVQVFLDRIARNRSRCERCGKGLSFPDVVTQIVESAGKVGGADLKAKVDYRCVRCDRSMSRPLGELIQLVQRGRAKCQMCGDALELPAEVHQAISVVSAAGGPGARRTVACPVCDQGVQDNGTLRGLASCSLCAAQFAVHPQSERGLAPPLELPPASADDLTPFLQRIAAHSRPAAELLHTRAQRQEVTIAEAVILAARIEALAAWSPREPLTFPMPIDEAVQVLGFLLVPNGLQHTDKRDMSQGGTLFLDLGGETKVDKVRAAANVLSVATLALGGAGVVFSDLDGESVSHELCVGLNPHGDGCQVQLGIRQSAGKVKPLPAKHKAALLETFAGLPPTLAVYYARLALYGPWAGGRPLLLASPTAAAARLAALGLHPQRYQQALGF